MLKNVGVSLFRAIKGTMDGSIKYGAAEALGIKEGAIGVAENENYTKLISAAVRNQIKDIEKKIVGRRDQGRHGVRQVRPSGRSRRGDRPFFFPSGAEAHAMEAILEARNILMVYENGVVANRDVSLAVEKNTIHAVVGENGAGKSTLMKILFGMPPAPARGRSSTRGAGCSSQLPRGHPPGHRHGAPAPDARPPS